MVREQRVSRLQSRLISLGTHIRRNIIHIHSNFHNSCTKCEKNLKYQSNQFPIWNNLKSEFLAIIKFIKFDKFIHLEWYSFKIDISFRLKKKSTKFEQSYMWLIYVSNTEGLPEVARSRYGLVRPKDISRGLLHALLVM